MKHHGCNEPPRREQPTYCGKVNTAGIGEYYSSHATPPEPGYHIPPVKPLFVPGMSQQEQIALLAGKVDEMCNLLGEYDKKVWGAYDAIVNACICNDAYYSEIETETGYLPATSAKYTVVHIPFVDKGNQPIRLQLGLAYNNTTNSGLHESVFDASERVLADKLFPATNIADEWTGKVYWQGAPISDDGEGFTLGVLKNGFLKIYNQTATTADMNKDSVENAMGVAGVLISGGKKTTENYGYNEAVPVGMVGLGMNYDTQERFFILVDSEQATGVTGSGGCTADQLADLFAKYGCTIAVLLAYKESTVGLDCGEMINIPYDENHIPYVPKLNAFWYITKEEHYHNDYVREVAELMQKYGRSIWTGVINGKTLDAVRAELANVESDLAQEVQDRKDGDKALDDKIASLSSRVGSLYNELVAADSALSQRIDAEIDNRQKAITSVEKALEETTKGLTAKDNEIANALTQEISSRTTADKELDTKITTEISDRKTADASLEQAIETETASRTSQDNKILETLENSVKSLEDADKKEVTARESADTALQDAIDKLKTDFTAFKTSTNTDLATKTEQITQILADISSVKNIMSGIQATQSEIDETLTSIQNTLAVMEKSFENLKQTVATLQTSWETYKEQMNEQYTTFVDTVEKALSDMQTALSAKFIPITGTEENKPVTGNIVMDGTHVIKGVAKPTENGDVANKKYVDDIVNAKLSLTGTGSSTMTGNVTFDGKSTVTGVKEPSNDSDVATKKFVDDSLTKATDVYDERYYGLTPTAPMSEAWICKEGGENKGVIIENVDSHTLKLRDETNSTTPIKITNVAEPTADTDAVNKSYGDSNFINVHGTPEGVSIDGAISMTQNGAFVGTGLASFYMGGDYFAYGKATSGAGIYITSSGDMYLTKSFKGTDVKIDPSQINIKSPTGGTYVKNGITLSYNKGNITINGIENPVGDYCAANKAYVDKVANTKIGKDENASFGGVLSFTDGAYIGGATSANISNSGIFSTNPNTKSIRINNGNLIFSKTSTENLIQLQYSDVDTISFTNETIIRNIKTPVNDNDAVNKSYADAIQHYVTGLASLTPTVTELAAGETKLLGKVTITNDDAVGKVVSVEALLTSSAINIENLMVNVTWKQLTGVTNTTLVAFVYLTNVSDTAKTWSSNPVELRYLVDTSLSVE